MVVISNICFCATALLMTSTPHDANSLNVYYGKMMSGLQDSFLLKLALQPIDYQLATNQRLVGDQLADSGRLVASKCPIIC